MPRSRRGRTARKDRPMRESDREKADEAPLNPALKSTTETAHDTDHTTPAPIDTASAKEGAGEGWPLIWLVVVAVCVVLTIYLIDRKSTRLYSSHECAHRMPSPA